MNTICAVNDYANFISRLLRIQGSFLYHPAQTALVTNMIVSINSETLLHSRPLSGIPHNRYFSTLICARIKRIGTLLWTLREFSIHGIDTQTRRMQSWTVSEAPGFSRTRIILGWALELSSFPSRADARNWDNTITTRSRHIVTRWGNRE